MSSDKEHSAQVTSEQPKREIHLIDLVFLSFGGQSPYLSVLSYGVYAYILAGGFAPIAIAIGTLLILLNGLVIYKLSSRFTLPGGYTTYAYFSLTKRLGFQTGWIYTLYSVLYGAAYVVATTIVMKEVFNVDPLQFVTLVLVISSILLLLGVRPTTKYAIIASGMEAAMMAFIAVALLAKTGWRFYDPTQFHIPPEVFAEAVIFGAGISTGYGSIAPVTGEVVNPKRNVPLAIIIVILLGGGLAAFDTYAISDYIYFKNLELSSDYSVISLVGHEYGYFTLAFTLFAALNDGILATMSFMLSSSRTIYSLSFYNFLPGLFKEWRPRTGPIYSLIATLVSFAIVVYSSVILFGVHEGFAFLGYVSMLGGFVTHIISDLALFKMSLKRYRKRVKEIALALTATITTVVILAYSVSSVPPIFINVFLLWVLLGFIYVEVLEMARHNEEE
ncbi:MAG: APC family permease [Thermoprotei archaeon]